MKKIGFILLIGFLSIPSYASESEENAEKCFSEITSTPFCVGLSHAEKFCSGFGRNQQVLEMAKEAFDTFVEEGDTPENSAALAFMGYSSNKSKECKQAVK